MAAVLSGPKSVVDMESRSANIENKEDRLANGEEQAVTDRAVHEAFLALQHLPEKQSCRVICLVTGTVSSKANERAPPP